MKLNQRTLFILPFVGIAIFSILAFLILEFILRGWFLARNESDLSRIIDVTHESIVRIQAEEDDMQLIVDNISIVATNYRVNIFNKQGQVLGDSFPLKNEMVETKTAKDFDEFTQSLNTGTGKSIRFSETMNSQMYYLAKRFQYHDSALIIRVGMNTHDYEAAVKELRIFLAIMAVGAFILIGLLLYAFSQLLKKSITKEQSLLESRVQDRTKDIQLLQRFASMLAACKYINEIEGVVEDIVPRLIGNRPCSISLVNSSRNLVELKIHWGDKWPGVEVYSPDECWALRKGKYHFSEDSLSSQTCKHMGESHQETLCIPLLAHGQTIGVFHIAVDKDFTEELKNVAFTLAEHLGLALANLSLQDTLRNQATRDSLTGLFNRRHMEQTLELEFNRATRYEKNCALLMLDIDHFKQFNDNFGHDAGDYVLKCFATVLKDTVRAEDVVCRVGGEEIAIILPETDIEQATLCAEKICKTIAEQDLVYHNLTLGQVTTSIGVSGYPEHAQTPKELVKMADISLYSAKSNGRNQYVVCEQGSSVVTHLTTQTS